MWNLAISVYHFMGELGDFIFQFFLVVIRDHAILCGNLANFKFLFCGHERPHNLSWKSPSFNLILVCSRSKRRHFGWTVDSNFIFVLSRPRPHHFCEDLSNFNFVLFVVVREHIYVGMFVHFLFQQALWCAFTFICPQLSEGIKYKRVISSRWPDQKAFYELF